MQTHLTPRAPRAANGRGLPAFRTATALWLPMLAYAMHPSSAQAQSPAAPPPAYSNVDGNGVDLVAGTFNFSMVEGSIGSGEGTLELARYWSGGGWRDNWSGGLYSQTDGGGTTIYIDFGSISDRFIVGGGGSFTSAKGDGATLVLQGNIYRYTASDGTVVLFQSTSDQGFLLRVYTCPSSAGLTCSIPVAVTKPNGMTSQLFWDIVEKCNDSSSTGSCPTGGIGFARFRGVSNTAGYEFRINYVTDSTGTGFNPPPGWFQKTGAVFSNASGTCGNTCPTVSYSTTDPLTVTDALGRAWRFTVSGQNLIGIKRPGSASADTTTIAYGADGVSNVIRDGVSYTYARSVVGNVSTVSRTDPLSGQQVSTGDLTVGRITAFRNEVNQTTGFTYDLAGRLTRVTAPELDATEYTPDARGNVTEVRRKAKPGSGLADIVTTAGFDAFCANPAVCNQPQWTRDAKGNQTDYTYDAATGVITSVTRPAPASGGVRPQTRYSYTGVGGVTLLSGVSACQTGSTCPGTADETRATVGYGANLQPASISQGSGDGALTASTAMTYDPAGNMLTADGPLPGTGDTTRYRYDVVRQRVGIIGPDPDGGGALKPRATRLTYNADGQVTLQEQGTVTDQSDLAWSAFATLQQQATAYDANARASQISSQAGGTTYSLTQLSYDALGRPDCTTVRMNPAVFGSLPAACTMGTGGSFGPDRITKLGYDAAGRQTSVITGFASSSPRTEATLTYTANGQRQTLADGKSNLTTWEYDGFDRVGRLRYPNQTGGGSSTTDYEGYGYDANSNIVSRRLRNNATILYAFDTLDRMTAKTLPTGNANLNPAFTYDNLGRLKTAANANPVYNTSVTFGYDALNRKVSETSGLNGVSVAKSMQYDLAGRRTRLTWSDGFYVDYDYNLADDMTAIRENGATSGIGVLATFVYDDLGRRTSLVRGNGTNTGYSYDGVSRVAGIGNNLATTSADLDQTFSYNPASQIIQQNRSNDAYAFTTFANGSTGYVTNGLNQYTGVTGITPSPAYDPRGNLITLGSTTYSYSAENELALIGTSNRLYYDALHRLVNSTSSATRFEWDGWNMTTIHNASGSIIRRFVFGPGIDEPLVWYEGSGTADRRWLHADERGSVISVSNAVGNPFAINAYDEYGVPKSGNSGRFQYTGQIWIPEAGMYYYKNRMYVPSLGRFAQTDPVGYDADPNLYQYVKADPINLFDSFGLAPEYKPYDPNNRVPDIVVNGWRTFDLIDSVTSAVTAFVRVDYRVGNAESGRNSNDAGEIIVTARKRLAVTLDKLADDYLRPPPGRQQGESYGECVRRVAGDPGLAASGATAIASGANIVPYPRAVPPGGSGTSIISTISRGLLRDLPRMGFRIAGTTSIGGAIGRVLSRVSVLGGAAATGLAAGKAAGAAEVCSR